MLRLPSSWVWDFWCADDGERFHVFFLKASRALGDPDARHLRASVGHAVSDDLVHWEEVADALVAADPPAYDDQAIWTGSVVRDGDGLWWLFYTGIGREELDGRQRVLAATSPDLMVWTREPGVLVEPDPRFYETRETSPCGHQAWRDPWVFRDGDRWRMLLTARAATGPAWDRGVVGHATSADLRRWSVTAPVSAPGAGFGQLEVTQVAEVEGRPVLLFSCLTPELADTRRAAGEPGGVWAAPLDSLDGPYDVARATLLLDDSFYVGRLVRDRSGRWQVLAFHHRDADGAFVGTLSDPMPVRWAGDRLVAEVRAGL